MLFMLLAVDIGNSTVKFGVFNREELVSRFHIPTVHSQTAEEIKDLTEKNLNAAIHAVIVSSVVPELNDSFQKFAETNFGQKPFFVHHALNFGLKILYDPPESLGIDRLVAAFAAAEKYGKPVIVCDFGTATTIDAVNAKNEFLGGIIAPGMNLLADALFRRTSQLPKVEVKKPESVFGNSTGDSIQSGIYFGYVGLVDGIVRRMIKESGENPKIIATGGFAGTIAESSETIETIDEDLMLEGLRLVYEKTTESGKSKADFCS